MGKLGSNYSIFNYNISRLIGCKQEFNEECESLARVNEQTEKNILIPISLFFMGYFF